MPLCCLDQRCAEEKLLWQMKQYNLDLVCSVQRLSDSGTDTGTLRGSMGCRVLLLDPSKMTGVTTYFHELRAQA